MSNLGDQHDEKKIILKKYVPAAACLMPNSVWSAVCPKTR